MFLDAIEEDASANRSDGIAAASTLLSVRLRLAENPTLMCGAASPEFARL